jgi:hypothetical protein
MHHFIEIKQDILVRKIIAFLELDVINSDNNLAIPDRVKVINYFKKSEGECAGLVSLWLYGKRMYEEDNPNNLVIDDVGYFYEMTQLLINWDCLKPFKASVKLEIECFISHLLFYQNLHSDIFEQHIPQLDLATKLTDTKGRKFVEVSSQEFIVNKKLLKEKFELLVKPSAMIVVGTENHAMAFYMSKDGNNVSFYDPNYGVYYSNKLEHLLDALWFSSDIFSNNKYETINTMAIATRYFSVMIFVPDYDIDLYSSESLLCVNDLNEVINIIQEVPSLHFNLIGNKNFVLHFAISTLEDYEIMACLQGGLIDELKLPTIIRYLCLDIENRSTFLARFLIENYHDLIPKYKCLDVVKKQSSKTFLYDYFLEFLISETVSSIFVPYIKLSETLKILSMEENIGEIELAEYLLSNCNISSNSNKTQLRIDNVVEKNLLANNRDYALEIMQLLFSRFSLLPSQKILDQFTYIELQPFASYKEHAISSLMQSFSIKEIHDDTDILGANINHTDHP